MESFPGFEIDEIAARKFGKRDRRGEPAAGSLRRGRHAGFLSKLHPAGGVRRSDGDRRRPNASGHHYYDLGAQLDLNFTVALAPADGLLGRRRGRLGGWPLPQDRMARLAEDHVARWPQLLVEAAHWGLALVPVLVAAGGLRLARRVQADELARSPLPAVARRRSRRSPPTRSAGSFLDTLPIGFTNYSRFVAPWIEEAIKAIVMIGLFRFNRIGYKLDAVISGFAIGAGFSVVENIIYLTIFPDYGAGTWLVRGLGTAVMHGTTLAILAGHRARVRRARDARGRGRLRLPLLVVPPRLSGRGRDPHGLQPVPGPAAAGDARRRDLCPDRAHRDFPVRH